MKTQSTIFHLSILFTSLFFLNSCNNSENGSDLPTSDDLSITSISTTAFTASVKGTFKGLSKIDLALGKNGVLYCDKTKNAESIFKSWLDGNDNPDCFVYSNGKAFNGESFSGKLEGLSPETGYSFCLFSQGQNASNRKISAVSSFTTSRFNPDLEKVIISDIGFITAKATVKSVIDGDDASNSTVGVLLSEAPDGMVNSCTASFEINDSYKPTLKALVNIQPDKEYYCRAFVKYYSDSVAQYKYGPEINFSSRKSNEFMVDLGLPSGVKWCTFDLGGYTINDNYVENTKYTPDLYQYRHYRWGSLKIVADRYDSNISHYEYWDAAKSEYSNLGANICSTEYDVVHMLCGGYWRMPSKEDVEELIKNCDCSNFKQKQYTMIKDGQEYQGETAYVGIVQGSNGNNLLIGNDQMWTGTICTEDNATAYCYFWDAPKISSTSIVPVMGKGSIEITASNRYWPLAIRPIWDPNIKN